MKPSAFLRAQGTLVLSAFLLVMVVVAVSGAFQTRNKITETFANQDRIVAARLQLEDLRKLQIDEENYVRGYTQTRDPFYREQYEQIARRFDSEEAAIRSLLDAQHLDRVAGTLEEYKAYQAHWRAHIAEPLLVNPSIETEALDKENIAYTDVQDRTSLAISNALATASDDIGHTSQDQVNNSAWARAFFVALFGLLAVMLNGYRSRLVGQLEEERTTTETLQRAFRSEQVSLPRCEVGSAYLSASSHLAVGGDVFDMYRLSDTLALILIADVSGKGVDAAVLTAFIKFTIRGIALRRRDPGAMLAEFNTAFSQTVENPYLFVSMFVGVLDVESFQLRYASAGHDSAFLRGAERIDQLAVTGPILGVMEEPFESKTLYLEDGDTLILATDGLTEARSRSGEQLHETGAIALIERCNRQPQLLADEIIAQVRALSGDHIHDDLAILAIRVHDGDGDERVADA